MSCTIIVFYYSFVMCLYCVGLWLSKIPKYFAWVSFQASPIPIGYLKSHVQFLIPISFGSAAPRYPFSDLKIERFFKIHKGKISRSAFQILHFKIVFIQNWINGWECWGAGDSLDSKIVRIAFSQCQGFPNHCHGAYVSHPRYMLASLRTILSCTGASDA